MLKSRIIALATAAAAVGLAVSAPAQARDHRQDNWRQPAASHQMSAQSVQIRSDLRALNTAIDRAAARRTISQREASGLRRDVRSIEQTYASYARGGLTRSEARMLDNRIDRVRLALRVERRDTNGRRG